MDACCVFLRGRSWKKQKDFVADDEGNKCQKCSEALMIRMPVIDESSEYEDVTVFSKVKRGSTLYIYNL